MFWGQCMGHVTPFSHLTPIWRSSENVNLNYCLPKQIHAASFACTPGDVANGRPPCIGNINFELRQLLKNLLFCAGTLKSTKTIL